MTSLTLAALLAFLLASAALADPVRCTTRYDAAFQRWVTTCSDGARAITRYDRQFERYQMEVITLPKGDKPPRGWPVPGTRPR